MNGLGKEKQLERVGKSLGTHNGGRFWVLSPHPEDVDIEGVAHALSHICRFTGHTKHFWSVAQHSLLVSAAAAEIWYQRYPDEVNRMALIGLLHDVSEVYLNDIARPIKSEFKEYLLYEEQVQNMIYSMFGVPNVTAEEQAVLDEADTLILAAEAVVLMSPDADWLNMEYMKDERLSQYINEVKQENMELVKAKFLHELSLIRHTLRPILRDSAELSDKNKYVLANSFTKCHRGVKWAIFREGKIVCWVLKQHNSKDFLIGSDREMLRNLYSVSERRMDTGSSILELLPLSLAN